MAELLGYSDAAGMTVLDVGCGQGIDVVGFATADAQVTGVDITPRHVELARMHVLSSGVAARAHVVLGDAEQLPLADESQDLVVSNGVLHHTPDFEQALSEIRRVLRPHGEARLIVYNRNSLHYWCNQVILHGLLMGQLWQERSISQVLSRNVEFSRTGARPLVRVYTRRGLVRALRRAGLVPITVTTRQYQLQDAFVISLLSRVVPAIADPRTLDWLGRHAGWYLIVRARRDD